LSKKYGFLPQKEIIVLMNADAHPYGKRSTGLPAKMKTLAIYTLYRTRGRRQAMMQ